MIHIPLRSPIPMLDNARIAKYHGVRGHVYVYKTIGSYQHIVANGYFPHNGSVDANPHPVTDSGASLANATISLSYYNTLVDVAVATYPRPAVDGDIIGMAYKNTPPRFAGLPSAPIPDGLPKDGTTPCIEAALAQRT